MSEVENTMNRLEKQAGVASYIIKGGKKFLRKRDGNNSDANPEISNKLKQESHTLTTMARNLVRDLDPSNDLTFLRIATEHNEIMVAPDNDVMIVTLQTTNQEKGN